METNTDTDGNDDIAFCELCYKPAWLHKYCRNKKNTLCQQMFCMFVNNRTKFYWLTEPVPAMSLYQVSDQAALSLDNEWCSFDHDIPNAIHIEREYGVTQLQRIKVVQRMTVYGTVAKDVPRDKWKTIPKAMPAIAAERARL